MTIYNDVNLTHPNFDDKELRTVIDEEFERFGGIQALGSMAAWLQFSRRALGMQVISKMKIRNVQLVAHSQSL